MAVTAGAMAGARVAAVEPKRDAVRSALSATVALRRVGFAMHVHLQAQAQLIPRQKNVRKVTLFVHGPEVVDAASVIVHVGHGIPGLG